MRHRVPAHEDARDLGETGHEEKKVRFRGQIDDCQVSPTVALERDANCVKSVKQLFYPI